MSNNNLYLLFISNLILVILGYIIGIITNKNESNISYTGYISTNKQNKKELEQNRIIQKIQSVNIDDSKVVIEADISGLEKKFEDITDTKHVSANIDSSINKLTQIMKGK